MVVAAVGFEMTTTTMMMMVVVVDSVVFVDDAWIEQPTMIASIAVDHGHICLEQQPKIQNKTQTKKKKETQQGANNIDDMKTR